MSHYYFFCEKFSPNNKLKTKKNKEKNLSKSAIPIMRKTWHAVQMFRAYYIFDAPAIVLATKVRLGNISILGTFVTPLNLKLNFPGKERGPWERCCTVYTCPQGLLHFQDGPRAGGL